MQSQDGKRSKIVWAKLKGFPWWPAVVSAPSNSETEPQSDIIFVRFIGENTHSHLPPDCVRSFSDYKSQYSKVRNKHLQESIKYAKKFADGSLSFSDLVKVNERIYKSLKKPEKGYINNEVYETRKSSDIHSKRVPDVLKQSGLLSLAEQASILSQKLSRPDTVLKVAKCVNVDLTCSATLQSISAIQQDADSAIPFYTAYTSFLACLKDMLSQPIDTVHQLPYPLLQSLQFKASECDQQKSLSLMVSLKDFALSLSSSSQLMNYSKLILFLKFEAGRLSASPWSHAIKDSVERLHSLWRVQFVNPITETTRETCRDLVKILLANCFPNQEAGNIACMSEFKLRGLDPSQGTLYHEKLAELKLYFKKMTVEAFRSIKNEIIITADS